MMNDIQLPKNMTISQCESIYHDLIEALDNNAFKMDLSQIEKLDTTGIQLILSILKSKQMTKEDLTSFTLSKVSQEAFSNIGIDTSVKT